MHKSKIFLYFSLCFILGIALRSFLNFDIFYAFIFLLTCLILGVIVWARSSRRIILMGAIFLFLGILRYEISLPKIDQNHIAFYNGQEVELIGEITVEPDVREKHMKLTIDNLSRYTPGTFDQNKNLKGKILVNVYKYGEDYNYGDWLQIKCKLEEPGIIESENGWRDFDYGRYLAVKGIYSVCYRPDLVEKTFSHRFTQIRAQIYTDAFYTAVINTKKKFKDIIDKNLSLPQSGLLEAMLLGYRREISPAITDQFSKAGVSHIIAISGLHITIMAGLLFYLLMALGVPRQKSFWPALVILFLYVVMIGFRASAVRALIMGAVLFYALKIGRLKKSINVLVLAAVVLLLINPKLLIFDVGFQLSFLAVLGILYFYPLFEKWLKFIPDKGKVRSLICLTLSAQVLTLPLIFYYFGYVSFVSPLANLLIIPVLPVVMVGGMIMIFLGLIWSNFAFVSGIFLWLVLSYVIKVTEILSQIPFSHFKIF